MSRDLVVIEAVSYLVERETAPTQCARLPSWFTRQITPLLVSDCTRLSLVPGSSKDQRWNFLSNTHSRFLQLLQLRFRCKHRFSSPKCEHSNEGCDTNMLKEITVKPSRSLCELWWEQLYENSVDVLQFSKSGFGFVINTRTFHK